MIKRSGIAPIVIVLLVALGLAGGATAGYSLKEPLKKAINGKTTKQEVEDELKAKSESEALGKNKFELEGIAIDVDAEENLITVKIKSSTASIKELRLSETPIAVSASTEIKQGSTKNMKIADIPIDSQVHVRGTIADDKLTASNITIQKENGLEKQGEAFVLGGTVKEVGTDSLKIDVATANVKIKDKKGSEITVKINDATIIEKGDSIIAISDVKAEDNVQITGVVVDKEYLASKIEVKVQEEGTELEEGDSTTTDDATDETTTTDEATTTDTKTNGNSVKSNSSKSKNN